MKPTIVLTAALLGVLPPISSAKPLKVFILAGQSNMQGHVNISTFDSMADDPKTAPILKEMRTAGGKPKVCDMVWISSIGCADDETTEGLTPEPVSMDSREVTAGRIKAARTQESVVFIGLVVGW